MNNQSLIVWIEASMIAVLAFLIALIPLDLAWVEIELGILPILIFSYRRGLKPGCLAGFLWGMIKLFSGDIWVLSLLQVSIEYIFAFAVVGLSGLARPTVQRYLKEGKKRPLYYSLIWSTCLATAVKYSIHFVAGVIFWSSYAPDGMGAYTYSFIVNGASFTLTSLTACILLILMMPFLSPLITHQSKI